MSKFSGLYITLLGVGCATTLAFAASIPSKPMDNTSPYSKGAEAIKEQRVKAEYFNRTNIPEGNVLDGDTNSSEKEDGINLPHSPSPKDARTPTDPHIAAAQKALFDEVTTASIRDLLATEESEEFTGSAGRPDNKEELAADLVKKNGLDIKRELTPEEKARNKALAIGLAGH